MPEPSSDQAAGGTSLAEQPPLEAELFAATESPGEESEPTYQRRKFGIAFWIALAWLVGLILSAVFANFLPIPDPNENIRGLAREGPQIGHWFGGDNIGKDVFARCIYGARRSLAIGFFSYLGALVIGGTLGLVAGYYRGRLESVVTSGLDVALAFPPLVLLIALVSFLGNSTGWIILALTVLAAPTVARIIRAQVLVYSQREFVLAARTLGARNKRVMVREVLPNVTPAVASYALIGIANLIVVEGALAFLGIGGVDTPSWGLMISQGRPNLEDAPHIVLFPSMMLFFTVLAMNYLGDRVREQLEVREAGI